MSDISNVQNPQISDLLQRTQTTQAPQSPAASGSTATTAAGASFADLLQDQLKVSSHAKTRMESRNINLSQDDWNRVLGGVQKASEKGAKESLVMINDVALVVSVKNRTVITAVDKDSLRQNVFTNIDSAVIV